MQHVNVSLHQHKSRAHISPQVEHIHLILLLDTADFNEANFINNSFDFIVFVAEEIELREE